MSALMHIPRILLIPFLATLLVACGGGGGGGGSTSVTPAGTGTVTLLVTDAPSDDFDAINLTVTRAELMSDRGRVELFSGEKTFDLLQLSTSSEIFSVTDVPAGTYDKIRLTLTGIELVLRDGSREYPRLPGNGKLDLNPRGSFYVESGSTLMIQLDMDAEKSIHVAGGQYNFRPVVFVDILTERFSNRLVRVTGTVDGLDRTSGDFDLCRIRGQGENDYIDHRRDDDVRDRNRRDLCVLVDTASADAAFFDVNGDSVTLDALSNGDLVTAAGHFAISGSRAVSKADYREERDSNGDRKDRDHGRDRGGRGGRNHDDDEDDDERHDEADRDDDEDDDHDRQKMVLLAQVAWTGTYADVKGVSRSNVRSDTDRGRWFRFEVFPGQGYNFDTPVATILQNGTRLFNRDGSPASEADIRDGVPARVNGVFQSGSDLKAALVVLETLDRLSQLNGSIGSVEGDYTGMILMTDSGDRCISISRATRIFESGLDDSDTVLFEQKAAFDLESGKTADVFGEEQADGCLAADTVLYQ